MTKLQKIILITGILILSSSSSFVQAAVVSNYKSNPALCPPTDAVSFPGQNCTPQNICGYVTNSGNDYAQCYNTAAMTPASSTNSGTGVTSKLLSTSQGGYVINCNASADAAAPYCDNGGNFWCNPDTTCLNNHVVTNCASGKWATDTSGNNTASAFSCATVTDNVDTYCISGYLSCDGVNTNCEVQKNVTNYPTGANNHYGATCDAAAVRCDTGRLDCDSSGVDAGNGCEASITNGAACTNGELQGTWSCTTNPAGSCTDGGTSYDCTCNTATHFITGIQATDSTSNPLLWGRQDGTGPIAILGNSTQDLFGITNTGNVGIGTTAPRATLEIKAPPTGGRDCCDNPTLLFDGGQEDWALGTLGTDFIIPGETGGFYISNDNMYQFSIQPNGNTGIGTASPRGTLEINNPSAEFSLLIQDGFEDIYPIALAVTLGGNVGIGTTAPQEALEVVGDIRLSDSLGGQIFAPNGDLSVSAGLKTCFSGDTLIRTPEGLKQIQEIKVGDTVSSYDIEKKLMQESKVLKTFNRSANEYYKLTVDNKIIRVTQEHPFYTKNGWKKVRELSKGEELFTGSSWVILQKIEVVKDTLTVFNMHVDGPNNYFAGGVLVHNKPDVEVGADLILNGGDGDNIGKVFIASNGGNVGIGVSSPNDKLEVGGNIRVTGGSFIDDGTTLTVPDYVFDNEYSLKSMEDLSEYIEKNKHLPNVPDMEDIKGWASLSLQDRDMKLLEKIEENILYILQLKEQIATAKLDKPTTEEVLGDMTSIYDNMVTAAQTLGLSNEDGKLVVTSDLNAMGNTTLAELTISGPVSAGLIQIQPAESSINTMGVACYNEATGELNENLCTEQTLFIQGSSTGNVAFFGNKVILSPEGKVKATEIETDKASVEELSVEGDKTVGQAKISAGEGEVKISASKVEEHSKIFISPLNDTKGKMLYIKEKVSGEHFIVSTGTNTEEDITFDWWIVN
jgi:hypothetical protein